MERMVEHGVLVSFSEIGDPALHVRGDVRPWLDPSLCIGDESCRVALVILLGDDEAGIGHPLHSTEDPVAFPPCPAVVLPPEELGLVHYITKRNFVSLRFTIQN